MSYSSDFSLSDVSATLASAVLIIMGQARLTSIFTPALYAYQAEKNRTTGISVSKNRAIGLAGLALAIALLYRKSRRVAAIAASGLAITGMTLRVREGLPVWQPLGFLGLMMGTLIL